jgi:hypothetical protein
MDRHGKAMECGHDIECTTDAGDTGDAGDAGDVCAKCPWYVAHYSSVKPFYYFISLQCTIAGRVREHGRERRPLRDSGHGKYR